MDPSKIDHDRQARVSAERGARRVQEARKIDMLDEIDNLETMFDVLRLQMGPENVRIGMQRLARLKKFVEDQ